MMELIENFFRVMHKLKDEHEEMRKQLEYLNSQISELKAQQLLASNKHSDN
jgi:phage shock protein A